MEKKTATAGPSSARTGQDEAAIDAELVSAADTQERHDSHVSYLAQLAAAEGATETFDRWMAFVDRVRKAAIQHTQPEDWVLHKLDEKETAIPSDAACSVLSQYFGIELFDIRPVKVMQETQAVVFHPELVEFEGGGHGFRAWTSARSKVLGAVSEIIEGTVIVGGGFTGRSIDQVGDSDLRSALLTLLRSKAARQISGCSKVPASYLKECGLDVGRCTKGHGFGSSNERRASKVAEEGVPENAENLRLEILRRVGGDESAAKTLLKEITAGKNFAGFTSTKAMTKEWQVKNAWDALKKHATFGDQQGQGEPGEQG